MSPLLRLLLIGTAVSIGNSLCPPPEFVAPCSCKSNILSCGRVSENELRRVFNGLRGYPGGRDIGEVNFKDYSLAYIPSGVLSGVGIKSLRVNTSTLASFDDPVTHLSAFLGVEDTMIWLTMNFYDASPNSRPDGFDWHSLSPLKNLRNIIVRGSLRVIDQPFPKLSSVIYVWIEDSDIRDIADGALAGLTGLEELRVRHNKFMKGYRRQMFPRPANNLTIFLTRGESLLTLPEDYFDEMPKLQYVEIPAFAHNIPPLNVNSSVNLQSSRGLTCDCRLKWLLRMRDQGLVNILHAICARPKHLFWRDVKSLSEHEL